MSPSSHVVSLFLLITTQIKISTSTRYYVDGGASSGGLGLSWNDDAFNTLESALSSAQTNGDEIWLKGGYTYIPSNPSDRTDCFVTNNGITIYGGFDGSESNINQRNTNNEASIISGDIGITNDNTDNCYHVIQYKQTLSLDTVTIQYGYANYNGNYATASNRLYRYGGGIITRDIDKKTSLYLNNVIIRNNTAINGGGIWISSSNTNDVDVIIKDSKFLYNHAIHGEFEGGYGGGIYATSLANITIFNTEFTYNHALYRGGAIYQDYGALLYVKGSTFDNNKVNGWGGAAFAEDGESDTGTSPQFISCTFQNNYAGNNGGAICWYNNVIGTLTNNVFNFNTAVGKGGAIALIGSSSTTTASTYNGNTANGDSATNDIYNESEFLYTTIDDTLSFDINTELSDLYSIWNTMLTEADLYPFNAGNTLCYVAGDNINSGQDGSTWNTAFSDLQNCLNQLNNGNGGEIWVKTGTYVPSTVPNWKLAINRGSSTYRSFEMFDNIRMYGGFIGTETSRDERNWRDNPTYLSGKINNGRQCRQLITAADGCLIDGFVFKESGLGVLRRRRLQNSDEINNILRSTPTDVGGGIYTNSTTIAVVNSIFYKLYSKEQGGAVYCVGLQGENGIIKAPTFINVAFLGNRAVINGGAIAATVQCDFVCKSCTFDTNSASKQGGAIHLDYDSNPVLIDNTFSNNYALQSGGCIAVGGQSVATFNATATFTSNYAAMEGGCLYSGTGVTRTIDQGFVFIELPTFTTNYMSNPSNSGQSDGYGRPYSIFNIADGPTTKIPTPFPTPAPLSQVPHTQPNIIIVFVDDIDFLQAWADLGVAPKGVDLLNYEVSYQTGFEMQNVAEFITESVVFQRTYSGAPICGPSRFSILTGRSAQRSEWAISRTLTGGKPGIYGTNVSIPTCKIYGNDSLWNIGATLQKDANNPYYTGVVGKWHVMATDDYNCQSLDTTPSSERFRNCTAILKQQGFDFVDAWYYSNIRDVNFSHDPEWMVSQSQKFIDHAVNVENKPFFLYFSTTLTHGPSATNALTNFYAYQTPNGNLQGTADDPINTGMKSRAQILAEAGKDAYNWLDDAFGALINYLKTMGIYDNTFLVFTNDHGMGAKGLVYEQGSRVANFVRYPPLFGDNGPYIMPADFIVSQIDYGAVIYELTGVSPPPWYYKIDGKSWINDVRNIINNQYNGISYDPDTMNNCCKYRIVDMENSHAISMGHFQYIYRASLNVEGDSSRYPNTFDREQLYDLINDPNQRVNQITNASYSSIITQFQSIMREYIEDTCPSDQSCVMPDFTFGTLSPTSDTTSPTSPASNTPSPTITTTSSLTTTTTNNPTPSPTNNPTPSPTDNPTPSPTNNPTPSPTNNPTPSPTDQPTISPTEPTDSPSRSPTAIGETWSPTPSPTNNPTPSPTINPTPSPTNNPTPSPTDSTSSTTKSQLTTNNPTSPPNNAGTELSSMSPTSPTTKEPSGIPTMTPTKTNIVDVDDEKAEESWSDPSSFGTTQYVVYILIVIILFAVCIVLIIIIKKAKDKQAAEYRKTKAQEATLSIFTTPVGGTNTDDVQMIQRKNKTSKHMMVPSASGMSYDFDDNASLKPYPSTKGHHLALPSMEMSNTSNNAAETNDFVE